MAPGFTKMASTVEVADWPGANDSMPHVSVPAIWSQSNSSEENSLKDISFGTSSLMTRLVEVAGPLLVTAMVKVTRSPTTPSSTEACFVMVRSASDEMAACAWTSPWPEPSSKPVAKISLADVRRAWYRL